MRICAIVLLALALGCGSDGVTPPSSVRVVTMTDNAFSPTPINIAVGETVRWTNGGTQPHNSVSATGIWTSPNLNPGQTFERTFAQAGTFQYSCTLHAGMNGTVVVQ